MARRRTGASELLHRWNPGRGGDDAKQEWDMARRYRKYERSLKTGAATTRGDGNTQAQYMNYREARERMRERRRQVRQLLYDRGIPMYSIVPYGNFTRHMGRVCREYNAATRRHLVHMALDRWCAKGLDREVLLAIAEEVFGLRLGT